MCRPKDRIGPFCDFGKSCPRREAILKSKQAKQTGEMIRVLTQVTGVGRIWAKGSCEIHATFSPRFAYKLSHRRAEFMSGFSVFTILFV